MTGNLHLIVPDPSQPFPVFHRQTRLGFAVSQLIAMLLGVFFLFVSWYSFLNPSEPGSDGYGVHYEFFALTFGMVILIIDAIAVFARFIRNRMSRLVACTCAATLITVFGVISAITFMLSASAWWKIAVLAPVACVAYIWLFIGGWWKGELGYRRGTHDSSCLPIGGAEEIRKRLRVVSPRQLPVPVDPRLKWYALAPVAFTVVYSLLHWVLATAFGGVFSLRDPVLWLVTSLFAALFIVGLAGYPEQERIRWEWRVWPVLWMLTFVVVLAYTARLATAEAVPVRVLAVLPAIWAALLVSCWRFAERSRREAYAQVVADFVPEPTS